MYNISPQMCKTSHPRRVQHSHPRRVQHLIPGAYSKTGFKHSHKYDVALSVYQSDPCINDIGVSRLSFPILEPAGKILRSLIEASD